MVLAEFFYLADDPRVRGDIPDEVMKYYNHHNLLGSGYGINWQAVSAPPKTVSQEKLSSIRKKRLERKMKKKFPLFAEQFVSEEIQRKQDYYSGITDAGLNRREQAFWKKRKNGLENC